ASDRFVGPWSTEIPVEVRQGTQRDAILFSVGANAAHGLRRTNEDKEKAVKVLLADEEGATWSDRRLADAAGVSSDFDGKLRARLSSDDSGQNGSRQQVSSDDTSKGMEQKRVGKDGRTYTVKPKKPKSAKVRSFDDGGNEPSSEPSSSLSDEIDQELAI